MSELLIRNLDFLNALSKATLKEQKAILNTATEDNIRALSEIALNILNGNLNISENTKKELEKHKYFLRKLVQTDVNFEKKKTSAFKKRKILKLLIIPLLSALGTVTGKVLSNYI